MPEINQERLALGTAALRSGKYPQAKGRLRQSSGYCCLGVLTEVAIANGLNLRVRRGREAHNDLWFYGDMDEIGHLTREVANWYGFGNINPPLEYDGLALNAIGANDEADKDFNWIADAFDATYGTEGDDSDV